MEQLSRFGIDIDKEKLERIVIYGLACTYSLIEKKIADYLRPFNLSPVKFNALMIIKHQGKERGLSQIDVGRRLIVSASNMTRLLDRMTKEGLIERCPVQNDRRINLIKITKRGSELLNRLWPGYCERISEISNLLSKKELNKLSDLSLKWFDKLNGKK